MPMPMVSMVATETPLCTGGARDVFYRCAFRSPLSLVCLSHADAPRDGVLSAQDGHAPYLRLGSSSASTTSVVFQTEHFSDPPTNPETDTHAREYRCVLTTGSDVGDAFEIVYDARRMYSGGVTVSVKGEGVECADDGEGVVTVKTTASGKDATVVITPK